MTDEAAKTSWCSAPVATALHPPESAEQDPTRQVDAHRYAALVDQLIAGSGSGNGSSGGSGPRTRSASRLARSRSSQALGLARLHGVDQGQGLQVRRRAHWLLALLRPRHLGVPVAVLDQHGLALVRRAPVTWQALREVQCITLRPPRGHEHLDAARVLAFVPHDRQVLVTRGLHERLAQWRYGTPLVLLEPALITPFDLIIDAIESLSDVPLVRIDDPPRGL